MESKELRGVLAYAKLQGEIKGLNTAYRALIDVTDDPESVLWLNEWIERAKHEATARFIQEIENGNRSTEESQSQLQC